MTSRGRGYPIPARDTHRGSRQFVVKDHEGNVWSFGDLYET